MEEDLKNLVEETIMARLSNQHWIAWWKSKAPDERNQMVIVP
jgi:hypothetical protein